MAHLNRIRHRLLQLNEPGTVTEPQSRGQFATLAGMTGVNNRLSSSSRGGCSLRLGRGVIGAVNFLPVLTTDVSGGVNAIVLPNLWKSRENARRSKPEARLKILFHNSLTTR
jgi:hypothetical protein